MDRVRPLLVIVDAYSLIYQVYHAIRGGMTGPDGRPTHAIFGIFRDLLTITQRLKPTHRAAAYDGSGPVFREQIASDYKAGRAPMPEDLQAQMATIQSLFEAFRFPVLQAEGMEADDVIATLARRGEANGMDVLIASSDKDLRQLISPAIQVYNLRKSEQIDEAKLQETWGIRPDQVVDLLALTGDSIDNVAGVPGIGQKTAAQLLNQFETLEGILANIDAISGAKRKENLRTHADQARKAQTLIRLREDVLLEVSWDDLQSRPYDGPALKQICLDCGFHRFLDAIDETASATQAPPPSILTEVEVIDSPESLTGLVTQLAAVSRYCLDTETTGLNPTDDALVGLAFCWEAGKTYYLPIRAPLGYPTLPWDLVRDQLGPLLADPRTTKVGQNLKFDWLALHGAGLKLEGPLEDTMIFSYLLDSGERNHSLNDLALRELNHRMIPITDLIGKGKSQKTMDEIPVEVVAEYAGEDVDVTWRLAEILGHRLDQEGLEEVYERVERPLIPVLARMEWRGIRVDLGTLATLSHRFEDDLDALEAEIYRLAGREFNIASNPQLRQILFDELGLQPAGKTPKGEASTSHEVLLGLAETHPLPAKLIQHRELAKLKSTYVDALPKLVARRDGRIHTSFNQVVAATGRLSSSSPNLQNIPVRTAEGRQIRQAFVAASEGRVLLAADYSQIELRILADASEDPQLLSAFAADQDIHTAVAAELYQIAPEEVQADQRRLAKTVNFGVLYGLSPYGLASRLGITQEEASQFIEAYFQQYAGVSQFIERTLVDVQRQGFVRTRMGRRRRIGGIKNVQGITRNRAEREAINTVIQGTAADLIKLAMIAIDAHLVAEGLDSRLVLQIHDELVFDCPESELVTVSQFASILMTSVLSFRVPLKVDLKTGPNWLETKPLTAMAESAFPSPLVNPG